MRFIVAPDFLGNETSADPLFAHLSYLYDTINSSNINSYGGFFSQINILHRKYSKEKKILMAISAPAIPAIEYANLHEDEIAALILVSPAINFTDKQINSVVNLADALEGFSDHEIPIDYNFYKGLGEKERWNYLRNSMTQGFVEQKREFIKDPINGLITWKTNIHKLNQPVLYIRGEKDRLSKKSNNPFEESDNVHVREIVGGRHNIIYNNSKEIADLTRGFVKHYNLDSL